MDQSQREQASEGAFLLQRAGQGVSTQDVILGRRGHGDPLHRASDVIAILKFKLKSCKTACRNTRRLGTVSDRSVCSKAVP